MGQTVARQSLALPGAARIARAAPRVPCPHSAISSIFESAQNVELLSFVRVQTVHIATPVRRPEHLAAGPVRAAHAQISLREGTRAGAAADRPRQRSPRSAPTGRAARRFGHTCRRRGGPALGHGSRAERDTPGGAGRGRKPASHRRIHAARRQRHAGARSVGAQGTARAGRARSLTITVDSAGHTKNVAFQPPLEASIEEQIRSLLASASWDPAVCGGGMTCEGQATITL